MSNSASIQRLNVQIKRMLSMPSSNKKKPKRSLGRTSAIQLSKSFQGSGHPPNSGTAVASASSSAKAVQSVIPKSAKGIHAGVGSQGVSTMNGSWS